jgi:TRAP-type C4-dicarboxylate transport system substrate-binding protein
MIGTAMDGSLSPRLRPRFLGAFGLLLGMLGQLALPSPLPALTIKVATLAPAGSAWVVSLQRLAADWLRLSGGQVQLKIYAGGIAGEEADMVRKMRIGQLQGAALSQLGLGLLDPGILALSAPFLISDEEELDYVLERWKPELAARMQARGFLLANLSKAGWAYFFGRAPITTPADLQHQRLGVPAGDAEFVETWRKIGFTAFSFPIGDLLAGLQAGLIDAFYSPPLVAAALQWFGPAPHMTDLRIAPVLGGVVLSARAADSIPEGLKPLLLAGFLDMERTLNREMVALEQEALRAMQARGLTIHPVPEAAAAQWHRLGQEGTAVVIGRSVPEEAYRRVLEILAEEHH